MNFKSCGDADDDDDQQPQQQQQQQQQHNFISNEEHHQTLGLSPTTSSSSARRLRRNPSDNQATDLSSSAKQQQLQQRSRLAANGNYVDETSIPCSSSFVANYAPACKALNWKLSSSSPFASTRLRFLLATSCLLAALLLLLSAPAADAKVTTTAHLYEQLIEGRLDTSQLCGTRYPTSAASSSSSSSATDNNLLYIVGGDEVEDEQFWPWSVAIYELDPLNGHKEFICSGSLVSDKFILTAAHCIQQSRFDTLSAGEVFVKIAAVRLDDERARFYHVGSVHIHPEYSVDRKANDIALLKLAPGQRLPLRARPICLPSTLANRIDFTDQQVTIIGWGKTNAMHGDEPTRLVDIQSTADSQEADQEFDTTSNGNSIAAGRTSNNNNNRQQQQEQDVETTTRDTQTNDTLLQAEVRVTNTDQCNRNYSKLEISWLNIDEHFLCASDPSGKRDACQGDSGGPLMWNNQQQQQQQQPQAAEKWYQLGLVSFGHGCANSQFPGVYTRISYYMPWIVKTINAARH